MSRPQKTRRSRAAAPATPATPAPGAVRTPLARSYLTGLGLVACALIVGLAHLAALSRAPWFDTLIGDGAIYDQWARRLAAGDWVGTEVFYQAPLYPYFLGVLYAVAGPDLLTVRLVQTALGAAAVLLVALAGAQLFNGRTGVVAGLMLALYPPVIFSNALIQKSALDILFVCASLWLFVPLLSGRPRSTPDGMDPNCTHRWRFAALGLVFGGLVLTRENAAVLLVPVVAWIACDRRMAGARLPALALLVAGVAVVLAPVAARNALISGELYLTTSQFGPNFYIGNRAGANGTYQSLIPRRGHAAYERQDAVDIAEAAEGRTLTPAEVSAFFTREAIDDIQADPAGWLRLVGRKVALLWNAVEIADGDDQYTAAEWSPLLRPGRAIWHMGVLGPLALAGLVVTWRARARLWPLYAMLVAYGASVVAFYVFARYRLPMVPLLVLFAAAGLVRLWPWARGMSPQRLAIVVVCVGAFAVYGNWPLVSPDAMRATMHYNLGVVRMQAGDPVEAAREFTTAVTLHPAFAEAHHNLGIVLGRLSRLDESRAAFERATEVDPQFVEAHTFLGRAHAAAGDLTRAEAAYRRVVELAPDSPGAHNDLAALLGRQGRLDEAARHSARALALDPDNVEAESNLAIVAATAGRLDEAASRLTRALALEPNRPQTHYNLGTVRARQGRLEEARAAFEATLRLDPTHEGARQSLDALSSLSSR